jgi:hypothetical protein
VGSILILASKLRSGFATIAGRCHTIIASDTHYPKESKYYHAIRRIH